MADIDFKLILGIRPGDRPFVSAQKIGLTEHKLDRHRILEEMVFRTTANVKEELRAYPRSALIITVVDHESRAVKAHLSDSEMLSGTKGRTYEYGRFSDPAGDWLVVHALSAQGNNEAGQVVNNAHQEFGKFTALILVGVAGSLKEDIPIGSVVIGDFVHNGHSAKVEDDRTLFRDHSLPSAPHLQEVARYLIYLGEWTNLILPPYQGKLPSVADYPCKFPPLATIKGIVSGEEVVAGGRSVRYGQLRTQFNDCGAVEMEGYGVMNACRHENTPAIIIRGISDMCAGKRFEKDDIYQPIAAAHAAAFAFSILSFLSKSATPKGLGLDSVEKNAAAFQGAENLSPEEGRVDIVFNFEGSTGEWSEEIVKAIIERIKHVIGDDKIPFIRIENGSVRIVLGVRESDLQAIDILKLREAASDYGVAFLGAIPLALVGEAEKAKNALATASVDLLAWEKTLPKGRWMERPEQESIVTNFHLDNSSTVLLGEPGSGKSALLSKIASNLLNNGATVFAIKSDILSTVVRTESDLQRELQLPALPSELILLLARMEPVYVLVDQLDALASQLDLQSGRLNVILNLVRRIGRVTNIHVLLSARTFEFKHDVRLGAIEAEAVTLTLPPWHEVRDQLAEVGVNPDAWPERAQDVIRIPQALKTFLTLVSSGQTTPFSTYQAMLEQLWQDRIALADNNELLISLVSDIAEQMAEEEVLWLAAARFDDRLNLLNRLEAIGFIIRSENSLSIAFCHQTVFDFILARTFVRNVGMLSKYVLERQESLFIRSKLWSALNYLRNSEGKSYEREFLTIWRTENLRRHLHILLIDFIGQVDPPLEFEKICMAEVLNLPDLRMIGIRAIGNSSGWFDHFAATAIRDAMLGSDIEVNQARRILSLNWNSSHEGVVRLIRENWLPYSERDNYSWWTVHECNFWTKEIEEIALTILKRSPIRISFVCHIAMILAVNQPEVALRLVRAKLDFLLNEVDKLPEQPSYPADGTDEEKSAWYFERDPAKRYKGLLESSEWYDLPSLAESAPGMFLQLIWPWYLSIFNKINACSEYKNSEYIYPGVYINEIELAPSNSRSPSREEPVMSAIRITVEEVAVNSQEDFLKWANENSNIEIMAVQQLIAHGYKIAVVQLASQAFEWLLIDTRRFQLGTIFGYRTTTINLVKALAPYLSPEEVDRFEKEVSNYRPEVPDHLKEPKQRKLFADVVRVTKKDLLQAIGSERLTADNRQLVATVQRALGNRFSCSVSRIEGGEIGSPMDAAAMGKAKDRDILKIFREIPDDTKWDHPTHWHRGGNIQLSRAFAKFAQADPERGTRLMELFEPIKQERAAGYALEAMADDTLNDNRVIEALLDLHARGFKSDEIRDSAAHAVEKIANRKTEISEAVINIFIEWLSLTPSPTVDGGAFNDIRLSSSGNNEDSKDTSILWGYNGVSILPGGNFSILSALASILLNKKEAGRDRYFAILEDQLLRERNPNIWKALLHRLSNAGGSTPKKVSTFIRNLFDHFPEILITQDAIIFLSYAQRWDKKLVLDLISDWRKSDIEFLQQAYGELVGLISLINSDNNSEILKSEIIAEGTECMKIGLAYAGVNIWPDEGLHLRANQTLIALLKGATKELVAVVMDVFRVCDELKSDASTVELLRALADPNTDMSLAPSAFVVERLQAMLPHEAELIAAIAMKLVAAWRHELGDMRTGTVTAAPQLTDLALTLHRLGGPSRQSGVALFEAMIELDAYGARETQAEIDGRFWSQKAVRQRIARRRAPH